MAGVFVGVVVMIWVVGILTVGVGRSVVHAIASVVSRVDLLAVWATILVTVDDYMAGAATFEAKFAGFGGLKVRTEVARGVVVARG